MTHNTPLVSTTQEIVVLCSYLAGDVDFGRAVELRRSSSLLTLTRRVGPQAIRSTRRARGCEDEEGLRRIFDDGLGQVVITWSCRVFAFCEQCVEYDAHDGVVVGVDEIRQADQWHRSMLHRTKLQCSSCCFRSIANNKWNVPPHVVRRAGKTRLARKDVNTSVVRSCDAQRDDLLDAAIEHATVANELNSSSFREWHEDVQTRCDRSFFAVALGNEPLAERKELDGILKSLLMAQAFLLCHDS